MNLLTRIGDLPFRAWRGMFGRKPNPQIRALQNELAAVGRKIRAKYDAAQPGGENAIHWQAADSLSAKGANTAAVRQVLRDRSRYEWANNCYCQGMTRTFANEVIGTGPRPQLKTDSPEFNREVERRFLEWMDATDLSSKLRIAEESEQVLGEMFGVFTTNMGLPCDVTLDIRLVEPDQITTPFPAFTDPTAVDGIRFDSFGNPAEYDMLKYHPGGEGEFGFLEWNLTPNVLQASNVIHWFTPTRAGQARGIPAITPALPLFAQMRRYTLAVLVAAEIAASFAAIIKTTYPLQDVPNYGTQDEPAYGLRAFETMEIARGLLQTLPEGTEMQQFRAEQPVTGYGEFIDRILKEICRCLEMPYGTATGDSSQYNYSSGRLDIQAWVRKVMIRRKAQERHLNRLFTEWAGEATKLGGYLPGAESMGDPKSWPRRWAWDAFGHVDPQKEMAAVDTGLRNCAKTLTQILAADGRDLEEHIAELTNEVEQLEAAGFQHPGKVGPQSPLGKSGMEQPPLPGEEEDPAEIDPENADQEEVADALTS